MRINENQKVTLTLGQLKKLVNENTAEPEGDLIPDLDAFLERELNEAVAYDEENGEDPGSFGVVDHSDECDDPDTYDEMGLDPSEVKIWQYVEVWIDDSDYYDYYLDLIYKAAERFAKQPFGDTISPDYEVSGNNRNTIMVAYTDTDVDAK